LQVTVSPSLLPTLELGAQFGQKQESCGSNPVARIPNIINPLHTSITDSLPGSDRVTNAQSGQSTLVFNSWLEEWLLQDTLVLNAVVARSNAIGHCPAHIVPVSNSNAHILHGDQIEASLGRATWQPKYRF
jgi:hypothetical protein